MGKKPYVKPMLVFENFATGELSGSPEMIEQIVAECEQYISQVAETNCPFEDMLCCGAERFVNEQNKE